MKQGGVFAALCYIATHFGAQEWVAKSIYKEAKRLDEEEVNLLLYQKMEAELNAYLKELLADSAEVVLENAYEIVIKEDIVMLLEENNLGIEKAKALLESDTPLDDVYRRWCKMDSSHMYEIGMAIESAAEVKIDEKQRECKAVKRGDAR